MEKGKSRDTNLISKCLDKDTKDEIDLLVMEASLKDNQTPDFEEDIIDFFKETTHIDIEDIRRYTGYDYKSINAVLRDNWTYEENGIKTEKKTNELRKLSERISSLIEKFSSTKSQFKTYRGTTIREFKKYGINTLEDLLSLTNQYLYDTGFTSTSLQEDTSYFKKTVHEEYCNIEIIYIIPENSNDGIPLLNDQLSYSKNLNEYLLDRCTLSKVLGVKIEGNTAVITTVLIPKHIWDKKQHIETPKKSY